MFKVSSATFQEAILRLETEARQREARQLDLDHEVGRLTEAADSAAAKYAEAATELAVYRKEAQEARTGTQSHHFLLQN